MTSLITSTTYRQTLKRLKERIYQAQYQAFRAVNKELVKLYWDIGETIARKQEQAGWGKSVVEQLAKDLQVEFPGIRGFSSRNIWRMRQLYETYKGNKKLPSLLAEIPWTHNVLVLEKCKDNFEREFYLKLTIKYDLSYRTLENRIRQNEYHRFLASQDNFDAQLEEKQAEKALMLTKDDYNLDFLLLKEEHTERELEEGLTQNVVKFLAEMGGYFAFVGRQYKVKFKEEENYVDLLFYHRKLKCLIAIELKTGQFKPEYAGKMQFYLSALDENERVEGEHPSIGIIICGDKDRTKVEYTLKDVHKPIGVGTYNRYARLDDVPNKIAKYLPSEVEIQRRLAGFAEVGERK